MAPARFLSLGLSRTAFYPSRQGASIAARTPVGTTVAYALDRAASVRFTVQRHAAGRRVGGRCVRPTRANRRRPRCARWLRVTGSFTHAGASGANSFRFRGRVGGRALAPGSYRLVGSLPKVGTVTPAPRRVAFRIKR